VPEPCDGVNGEHAGPVRFYRTGWKCSAHAPLPGHLGLPDVPPHYKPPKLTPAQRDEIRQRVADGESTKELAAEFGVSVRTIQQNS
jgi:DNA-binding NarL/FixJ family response regulator